MTNEPLAGKGFAHMEKNWGREFPDKWVWAQGMRLNRSMSRECRDKTPDSPEASVHTLPHVVIKCLQNNQILELEQHAIAIRR